VVDYACGLRFAQPRANPPYALYLLCGERSGGLRLRL